MKINDRHDDLYAEMVDKYGAKEYVSKIIGREYIIPTIGVYDSFDEIDFEKLPNRFVVKCTHDSGGLFIIKDKSNINYNEIKKKCVGQLVYISMSCLDLKNKRGARPSHRLV